MKMDLDRVQHYLKIHRRVSVSRNPTTKKLCVQGNNEMIIQLNWKRNISREELLSNKTGKEKSKRCFIKKEVIPKQRLMEEK